MPRLDSLTESEIWQRVDAIRRELDEIKQAQSLGTLSVPIQRVATGNDVDFTMHILYNTINIWQVTFTPADMTFEHLAWIWRLFILVISQTGTGNYNVITERISSSSSIQTFRIYVAGTSVGTDITIPCRLVIYSLGQGSIAVVQIQ